MRISVKRMYEDPHRSDGLRILVDRLWPRGIRKENLRHDRWLKEVAPSAELRTWYGHRPDRFREFARLYRTELRRGKASEALKELREHGALGGSRSSRRPAMWIGRVRRFWRTS